MIPPFNYRVPTTLQEACGLMWDFREKAKVIAGGTDLVISLRKGSLRPEALTDITRIPELQRVEERDGIVSIGGAVTHSEIASSLLIKEYGRVLSDAASEIGSPQIRSIGTIGGNIVNGSPAADLLPPLIVLEAVGRVVSKEREREVPVGQLFKGPYRTELQPDEILTHIYFKKLPPSTRSAFIRLTRREGMAIARMSVATLLQREGDFMRDVRISVGAVTPAPQRMTEAESLLKDQLFDETRLKMAARKVSEEMIPRSGLRPSTSYKAPVVEVLVIRALRKAFGNLR